MEVIISDTSQDETFMVTGPLKGIVFDLDGTLIHSRINFPKMKRRMIDIFEANGVPQGILSTTETNVVIFEKAEKAWDENGKPEHERGEVRAKLEETMNQVELEAVQLIEEVEGAADAILRLKEASFRLAVLTRSHHAYALEALKKIRIQQYFDLILGRNETPKPKPYAEALEHTAELMGLSVDELLFVGDHQIDYTSALNARCNFIGVRTGPRGNASWFNNIPDVLIDSVRDLPDYLTDR